MSEGIETLDTFPKLLMHHAHARGDAPAIREKDRNRMEIPRERWKAFAHMAIEYSPSRTCQLTPQCSGPPPAAADCELRRRL